MKTHKEASKKKVAASEPLANAKQEDQSVEGVSSEQLIEKMRIIRENRKLLELATSKITAQQDQELRNIEKQLAMREPKLQ